MVNEKPGDSLCRWDRDVWPKGVLPCTDKAGWHGRYINVRCLESLRMVPLQRHDCF